MHFQGKLYRALNPVYAHAPLSGGGAALYGGRFNRKGTDALYTSLSVMTALREANQAGSLQPTTLISYEADIVNVFDSRDDDALRPFGMDASALADASWRDQVKAKGRARTQLFADALIDQGFHGLLVRSFARGSSDDDFNLVLWTWSDAPPSKIMLVDDEGRLTPR